MKPFCLLIAFVALLGLKANAQKDSLTNCGQAEFTERFFRQYPEIRQFQEQIQYQLQDYQQKVKTGLIKPNGTQAVVTLPVVVHIIHNNGSENIPDAQVFTAIQHLNEAFANTGYYDPADGVNTQIQFCLAQRDPNNNPTNGIDRVVSSLTVIDSWNNSSADLSLKNLSRWNPKCYINIWLVKEIQGPVAGYAYLPSAHGMNIDGIVQEAGYFGTSFANDVVAIHEMGHYLGLYHTFQGACKNDDCSKDGDQVCDTPPDQSTVGISCNSTVNTCSTDALSGFSTDVNDLHTDYLDYGNWNCMKVFTQGQADRMNWMIQNVRKSLLACKSCLVPCPSPVSANFSSSSNNVTVGTTVNFTNGSTNASGFRWYINGVLFASSINFSYTFTNSGTYIIKLTGLTSNSLCDSASITDTVRVYCPVTASFTPGSQSVPINTLLSFTNTSTAASNYLWRINGVPVSTAINYSFNATPAGFYEVRLTASNGYCSDSSSAYFSAIDTTTGPTDSCNRNIFQKLYTHSSALLQPNSIEPTSGGGTIIAGNIASVNRQSTQALAIKIDNTGKIDWANQISGVDNAQLYKLRQAKDGSYIGIGTGNSGLWLIKLSSLGNLVWSRHWASQNAIDEGTDLLELSDGSIAVVGHTKKGALSEGIILATDPGGTILWTVQLRGGDETRFTGLVENNGQLLVSGYTYLPNSATTQSAGVIVTLDKTNGTLYNTTGFLMDNKYNTYTKIYRNGAGYLLSSSIISNFTTQEKNIGLLKLDQNLSLLEAHALLKSDFSSITQAGVSPDGKILAPVSSNPAALLFKVDQNALNPVDWKKSYNPGGANYIVTNAISNGSYPMLASSVAETSPGSNIKKILVVRADSLGNTAQCATGIPNETVKSVEVVFPAINWSLIGTYNYQNRNYQVSPVPVYLTVSNLCGNCDSLILPPNDTCRNLSFQKRIGGDGNDIATDIKVNSANEYLIAGTTNSRAGSPDYDGLLIKLNKYGNKIWQKAFASSRIEHFTKLLLLKQGDYLALGVSTSMHSSTGSMIMVKLDTAGNIIWQKEHHLQAQSLSSLINISGALELPDGSFAFCGNANGINTDVGLPIPTIYNFIGRTDKDGNLLWIKRSRYYYWESGHMMVGIAATESSLVTIVGDGIMKVSQADGTLIGLQKKYAAAGIFTSIERYKQSLVVYSNNIRLDLDTNINIMKAVEYKSNLTTNTLTYNGFSSERGLVMQGWVNQLSGSGGTWLTQFSELGVLQNSIRLPFVHPNQEPISGTRLTSDNGIFGANVKRQDYFTGNADIFIIRTDSLARMPDCPRASQATIQRTFNIPLEEMIIRFYPIVSNSYQSTLTTKLGSLGIENLCTGGCNQLSLSGKDTICNLSDTFEFKAARNQSCLALTDWSIDTSRATIVSYTDSSIFLQFKQAGRTVLFASLSGSCRILVDSFAINILLSPDSLHLGPDIQLCKLSTYTLHAGSGFRTYRWQDGSLDSTFTLFEPGTYFVEAEDYCGNILRDTVIVTLSPDIPFDLGPDLEKCNNDTVTITAPAGFINYHWSPNYQTNSINSRIIQVAPISDTMYRVVAEKSPGCVVTDSIKVTVKKSPPVNIGADTVFCVGDTVTLQATGGFNAYLWNDLSTNQNLAITVAGTYSVSATFGNGCVSRDTLYVAPLYPRPVIELGKDFDLCSGNTVTVDAGVQFSYWWNDGSTGRAVVADKQGLYWVQVTNSNGCKNTDSVRVISLKDSPKEFLDSTVDLCIGQKITLKGKTGFEKYRWYNNATGSSTEINSPGIYWLEVTNTEGCTSRDSILVKAKDCAKGVFFPNAFTPGNGGRNDYFRPIVYGQLESFYMVIYNRWGQKIFETRNAQEGWNGRIGVNDQQTTNFVWMARYKFVGEKEKLDKGIVILVR